MRKTKKKRGGVRPIRQRVQLGKGVLTGRDGEEKGNEGEVGGKKKKKESRFSLKREQNLWEQHELSSKKRNGNQGESGKCKGGACDPFSESRKKKGKGGA